MVFEARSDAKKSKIKEQWRRAEAKDNEEKAKLMRQAER
jgi:hypothetical protein